MKNAYAVIMAGGVGSRFWPASRKKTPKQLHDLTGNGKTMIADTVARVSSAIPPERVIVVTGEVTVDAVAKALPDVPRENILAEPKGRNTAPCIGWAAVHIKNINPEGILAVMPSDHLVADLDAFSTALKAGVNAAAAGSLVTFGIKPSRPETGFGYIELGDQVSDTTRQVIRFVEKPDSTTAEQYLKAGNFVWNSGMFFFSATQILAEIERQMPELKKGLDEIASAIGTPNSLSVLQNVFPNLPAESIDYGIMEGAKDIKCVPVDFGWSDLGSWEAAYELSSKDTCGNTTNCEVVAVDAKNCMVKAPDEKLVALVGVEDLIVVDTGDALLICDTKKSQDVKKIVDKLKSQKKDELL